MVHVAGKSVSLWQPGFASLLPGHARAASPRSFAIRRELMESTTGNLDEALLEASRAGHFADAKRLLNQGVDPDVRDEATNTTALGLAAFGGHRELCKLLLKYGADWDTSPKDVGGETAVDDAVRGGHKNLAEYLRYRLAQDQTAMAKAEAEAKQERQAEILARKAKYTQLLQEQERRLRGVKLAQQMQRAAEHQYQARAPASSAPHMRPVAGRTRACRASRCSSSRSPPPSAPLPSLSSRSTPPRPVLHQRRQRVPPRRVRARARARVCVYFLLVLVARR